MSRKEILQVLKESFEADRQRSPEEGFQQMVNEGRIDADGKPIWRNDGIFVSKNVPEPDDRY